MRIEQSISPAEENRESPTTFEVDTNHLERIRVVPLENQKKPYKAWGVITIDGLPYCFSANYTALSWNDDRKKDENSWSLNAPIPAHEFQSTIISEKLFDKELDGDEKTEILTKIGVSSHEALDFTAELDKHGSQYAKFMKRYWKERVIRDQFSQTVKQALVLRVENLEI